MTVDCKAGRLCCWPSRIGFLQVAPHVVDSGGMSWGSYHGLPDACRISPGHINAATQSAAASRQSKVKVRI